MHSFPLRRNPNCSYVVLSLMQLWTERAERLSRS